VHSEDSSARCDALFADVDWGVAARALAPFFAAVWGGTAILPKDARATLGAVGLADVLGGRRVEREAGAVGVEARVAVAEGGEARAEARHVREERDEARVAAARRLGGRFPRYAAVAGVV
jgi:hypothetical protein